MGGWVGLDFLGRRLNFHNSIFHATQIKGRMFLTYTDIAITLTGLALGMAFALRR